MKIEPNRVYRTRDGRKVRIYAVDGEPYYPVHGAYFHENVWNILTWSSNGEHSHLKKSRLDIVSEWKETKKITVKCWWRPKAGDLIWSCDGPNSWIHIREQDIEIEVEE